MNTNRVIYGSKVYSPESDTTYTIEAISEKRLGMYAENLTEDECFQLFQDVQTRININQEIKIIEIHSGMSKIVMMFDRPTYREWDCLYVEHDKVYYPIGVGLAASFDAGSNS